ncbi:MAG: TadE/TadG family type IV pilus assembly protein [Promethearchaeota archaeon]
MLLGKLLNRFVRDRRGSPLVEEGILIGLALFAFLLVAGVITGIFDWFLDNADQTLQNLGGF